MHYRLFSIFILTSATWAFAQESESGLSARRLYYLGAQPSQAEAAKPTPPAKPVEVAKAKPPKQVPTKVTQAEAKKPEIAKPEMPAKQGRTDVIPASDNKKPRLGLRYNVLMVDPKGASAPREVDPETEFREGDCVAIRFTPNRSGYLYVLNQGSTGQWQALLPSPEMPEESNVVQAFRSITVPENYCFAFDNNPGTERLMVIISDSKRDVDEINEAIRSQGKSEKPKPSQTEETPALRPKPGESMLAANMLNSKVDSLAGQMRTRDLKIQKVAQPMSRDEPPHSVYVVAANYRDQDLFMLEIKLVHK
jgi:hypothetical protein